MKNSFKYIKATLYVFAFICTTSMMAQPGFDDNVIDNNDAIPLDGGLTILLVGAAAYGVKKLRDNKNDKF